MDRTSGKTGFCGEGSVVRTAAALLHYGEEPPISGEGGSGTVFFTGCTLRCGFCQNYQLSSGELGAEVTTEELSGIFLRLQDAGAENINLVTGTHFVPGIAEAVDTARKNGLDIPVVWNTSGYENVETVRVLDRFVSIYLPDIKTVSPKTSGAIYGAENYADTAKSAVKAMVRERPLRRGPRSETDVEEGVIVRHLVLPGLLESTREVLEWFAEEIGGGALFSLMFQYTPAGRSADLSGPRGFSSLARRITEEEYETVMGWLGDYDIKEGFVQEFEDDLDWFPDFRSEKPFSAEKSKLIWHCR